jgi:Tat protein translocase TatB subunit
MFGIGMQELLIVAVAALLVVGPKRLPEVAQMLGKGYAQLKKAADDLQGALKAEMEVKRAEELKKKYPHLAVEDAPTPAPATPPGEPPEVPTHYGEGEYSLSDSHPMPAAGVPAADGPGAVPPAAGGAEAAKKND